MSLVPFRTQRIILALVKSIKPGDSAGRTHAVAAWAVFVAMPCGPVLSGPHPDQFEAADGAMEVLQ